MEVTLSTHPRQNSAPSECEGFDCKSGRGTSRSLCLSCDSTYCEICWDRQGPHKKGKVGVDGLPHEKTDKQIYDRLKIILEPPEEEYQLSRLHIEDEDTTWFAVEKEPSGQPMFHDYGRYAALMAETKQPNSGVRYPQLVSFVGQTGAGKSTLIKMLVSLKEQRLSFSSTLPFRSPVVGSVKNDKSPTSGDVHLYVDPETAYGPLPLLYADCEGLEGGETAPRANQLRDVQRESGQGQRRQRLFSTRPRELLYAKKNSEAMNREWAVRKVYPRLLYTFSDVVVFVLRNTRTFESSALKLLLEWASTSLEYSVNQPTLPHAIIVLNASSTSVDEEEWDTSTATRNLMQHVAHTVDQVPDIKTYADHWRRRGHKVHDMLDLFRCYYADICVVRIPTKGRYMLADTQIDKLHHRIVQNCDASFKAKNDAHMLSNADELNTYLQAGFDHFTTKENQPFNFVEVALKNNPIPRDFGDHILGVAADVRTVTGIRDGPKLFLKLSFLVASCIFIDCIRQRRPGVAAHLFDQFYASSCTAALEHFCDKYWPCSFISRKGKPCVNVKSSHSAKGHQNAKGKIISAENYVSHFSSFQFSHRWQNMIKEHLQQAERQFVERKLSKLPAFTNSDDAIAYELHREHMGAFFSRSFENFDALKFNSLTTCYSCLMEVPQHPLQCSHVLCTACVRAYGRPNDRNSVLMDYCPLHTNMTRNTRPWLVHFKPDYAGVRVLTLDGGGIRGIVELEVLRAVEQALGGKMTIQAFFDLIVGTSTGGIIALGLGVKQWSLNHCITEFIRLCDRAFTPREFDKVAGLTQATTIKHGSKYKTQPLQHALHKVFGEEQLYGGLRKAYCVYDTKVAVTATSGTGQRAVVLANYSRQAKPRSFNRFSQIASNIMAEFKAKPFKLVSQYFQVLVNRIDKILDSEREWKQFCSDVLDNRPNQDNVSRYIRVNVDLGEDPPALDDKNRLADVQAKTSAILKSSEYQSMIEKVAHRLIASSFYFLKDDRISFDEASNLWLCTGKIVSRFEGNSTDFRHNMRSLGEFLRSQQGPGFQPFFSVKEKADDPDLNKIDISQTMIEEMMARAQFYFDSPVQIKLSSQLSPVMIYLGLCETQRFDPGLYPISGFPRCLVTEDTINASRLDKRAELIRERRYNALPVANDPKVAYPKEGAASLSESGANENEDDSDDDFREESHAASDTTVVDTNDMTDPCNTSSGESSDGTMASDSGDSDGPPEDLDASNH